MYFQNIVFQISHSYSMIFYKEMQMHQIIFSKASIQKHEPHRYACELVPKLLKTLYETVTSSYSCNKITTTWIQISRQNWNGFYSNASQQIMI